MDSEVQRLERRLQDWTLQNERNKDARAAKQTLIEQKREEAQQLESQHQQADAPLDELQRSVDGLRQAREEAQQQAAQVSAELAGLEERRRGAESSFARIDRMYSELSQRVAQIE